MAMRARHHPAGTDPSRLERDHGTVAARAVPSARPVDRDTAGQRQLAAGLLLLGALPVTALSEVTRHATTVAAVVATWGDLLVDALGVRPAFAHVGAAVDASVLTALGATGDITSIWAAALLVLGGVLTAHSSMRVLAGAFAMTGATMATVAAPMRALAHLGGRPDLFADVPAVLLVAAGVLVLPVAAIGLAMGEPRRAPSRH